MSKEAINDSSKAIAQVIDKLKHSQQVVWLPPYEVDIEIKECIELLESALVKLVCSM